jgi:hypothetical protein
MEKSSLQPVCANYFPLVWLGFSWSKIILFWVLIFSRPTKSGPIPLGFIFHLTTADLLFLHASLAFVSCFSVFLHFFGSPLVLVLCSHIVLLRGREHQYRAERTPPDLSRVAPRHRFVFSRVWFLPLLGVWSVCPSSQASGFFYPRFSFFLICSFYQSALPVLRLGFGLV